MSDSFRLVNVKVGPTCENCPYLEYDPNYGMSYDSGYDCRHEDGPGRIVNDGILEKEGWLKIPEGCPLKII